MSRRRGRTITPRFMRSRLSPPLPQIVQGTLLFMNVLFQFLPVFVGRLLLPDYLAVSSPDLHLPSFPLGSLDYDRSFRLCDVPLRAEMVHRRIEEARFILR
jgi:hypothetical protein